MDIDKKGGVENVIIDMSVNAGGDAEIMGKLIALLSKDNYGYSYFYDNLAGTIYKDTFRVDTNKDGKYDEKDSFGNKFKFYLLTSPVAFSCGTAYPFLCQAQNVAKIMGAKSGGGECVVRTIVLPNGQVLAHSSYLHIVKPVGNNYIGDEGAFEVDIDVDYFDFYKLDLLAKKIVEDKE
jgi:C-terminal processing protease CtpA/Prc